MLRALRDQILVRSTAGRAVVRTYYRVSPPLARVIERHGTLRAIARAGLHPVIVVAGLSLASPRRTFVGLAVTWSALVALIVMLAFAHGRATARRGAFVVTFVVTLSLTFAAGLLDLERDASSPIATSGTPTASTTPQHRSPTDERGATVVPRVVPRPGRIEPPDVEHYDIDLKHIGQWLLAPGAARVRPTVSSGQLGFQIESDLADGILTTEGFTVTEPKVAAALGITSGDRILAINGYPPAGGAFVSFLLMQRDPDRNTIKVELDRDGIRMQRSMRVR